LTSIRAPARAHIEPRIVNTARIRCRSPRHLADRYLLPTSRIVAPFPLKTPKDDPPIQRADGTISRPFSPFQRQDYVTRQSTVQRSALRLPCSTSGKWLPLKDRPLISQGTRAPKSFLIVGTIRQKVNWKSSRPCRGFGGMAGLWHNTHEAHGWQAAAYRRPAPEIEISAELPAREVSTASATGGW
jgi:hypothetical protein